MASVSVLELSLPASPLSSLCLPLLEASIMTSPCPARCSRRFLEETPRNSFRVQEGAYVEANHSARKRRTVSGPCVAVRHRRVVRRRQVSRMVGDVAGCLAGPVRR